MIEKDYYHFAIERGIDYLSCGFWQEEYCRLLSDLFKKHTEQNGIPLWKNNTFLDVGCACGLIPYVMKKNHGDIFVNCIGIDSSEYMIGLGREKFNMSDKELFVENIIEGIVKIPSKSVDFLHCSQVLEHIPKDKCSFVISEFKRVLRNDGVMFLSYVAGKNGKQVALIKEQDNDPTHINITVTTFWNNLFKKYELMWDYELSQLLQTHDAKPDKNGKNNFFQEYINGSIGGWVVSILVNN